MDKKVKVNLNDFTKLKEFAHKVCSFESDVNIIKGSIIYDAKSILGVINISPTGDTYVEIISDNEEEVKRFIEEMSVFA